MNTASWPAERKLHHRHTCFHQPAQGPCKCVSPCAGKGHFLLIHMSLTLSSGVTFDKFLILWFLVYLWVKLEIVELLHQLVEEMDEIRQVNEEAECQGHRVGAWEMKATNTPPFKDPVVFASSLVLHSNKPLPCLSLTHHITQLLSFRTGTWTLPPQPSNTPILSHLPDSAGFPLLKSSFAWQTLLL